MTEPEAKAYIAQQLGDGVAYVIVPNGVAEVLVQRPQPHYDFEYAGISAWLKENGYTMHVSLRGEVELRKRPVVKVRPPFVFREGE